VTQLPAFAFEGKIPSIGKTSYVSHSADVIGDVAIGEGCFIGPGARIKGDYGTVRIGSYTSIQENCVVHARPSDICVIGDYVTVGHGAIIHTATIENYAVIGMGAVVSDFARVGEWGVVGEGAVVTSRTQIPSQKICVGIPAKIIGEVDDEYKQQWMKYKNYYRELAERRYPQGLKRVLE